VADTKPVTFYEFYYPDHRSDGPVGFVANGVRVDHEAGDTVETVSKNGDMYHLFKMANGHEIVVPTTWLWVESHTQQVPKKPTPPTA
jgi:hypothetical protein